MCNIFCIKFNNSFLSKYKVNDLSLQASITRTTVNPVPEPDFHSNL